MRQRSALKAFVRSALAIGAASSLTVLASCTDFLTGQDPEPPGPLTVTRLTLSNLNGVFTDTSAPLDCSLDELKDTPPCVNAPFKDRFSPKMSPPDPDSGGRLRVVFNKIPLLLNGKDLETTPADGSLPTDIGKDLRLIDPNVVQLQCEGSGCGVPMSYNSLDVSGSSLSPDPTTFDYGPALMMQVATSYDPAVVGVDDSMNPLIPDDDLRALEPGTVYHVVLNPGLSGRNADEKLVLDARAAALLSFSTLPFQQLRFGIGDLSTDDSDVPKTDSLSDPALSDSCVRGSGVAADPYIVAASSGSASDMSCMYKNPANNGVMALYMNAGIHSGSLLGSTATATVSVNGGADTAVPVVLSVRKDTDISMNFGQNCKGGNQRALYIAPASGKWVSTLAATDKAVVTVILRGADIRDVSQAAGHGPGRHVLSGDVVLQATIDPTDIAIGAQDPMATTVAQDGLLADQVIKCQ